MSFFSNNFFTKKIALTLLIVIVVNLALFAAIFQVQIAHAQMPVIDPVSIATTIFQTLKDAAIWAWDKIQRAAKFVYDKAVDAMEAAHRLWERLTSTGQGIVPQLLQDITLVVFHQAMAKITNDVIAWINGGGKGKIRIMQDPGQFLRDTLDQSGGILAGAILNVDPRSLCNADFLKLKLAVAFTGPYAVQTFDESVQCTFSGMSKGLRKFQQDFKEGGWTAFVDYSQAANNPIGNTIIVTKEMKKIKSDRNAEGLAELGIGKGFRAQQECVITAAPRNSISSTKGGAFGYANIHKANMVGKKLDEGMKTMGFKGNEEEFKGAWIAHGGKFDCKIVTPSQTISDLLSETVQAPMRKLEDAANAMTKGSPGIVRPYVLAITNAVLNLALKKGIGIVSATFRPKRRRRKTQRRSSASLQENARLAQSARILSGSVNGFRKFIVNKLSGLSSFIASINMALIQSDHAFGRVAINLAEFNNVQAIAGAPPFDDALVRSDTLDRISATGATGEDAISLGSLYTVRDQNGVAIDSDKRISTYPAGKVFHDVGQACGSFPQIIENKKSEIITRIIPPYPLTQINPVIAARDNIAINVSCPRSWQDGSMGTCALNPDGWVDFGTHQIRIMPDRVYNDIEMQKGQNGWASRFVRETRAGGSVTQRITIINGVDMNADGAVNSIILPPGITTTLSATSTIIENFKKLFVLKNGDPEVYRFGDAKNGGDIILAFSTPNISIVNGEVIAGDAVIQNNITQGIEHTQPIWERYRSPSFSNGSVTLLSFRRQIQYFFDIAEDGNANNGLLTDFIVNKNSDFIWMAPPFYPQLHAEVQEAKARARMLNGVDSDIKYYDSALSLQIGGTPDDDPFDNSSASPVYFDRDIPDVNGDADGVIGSPWDNNKREEGYKGSVSDVLTKYREIAETYQSIFAGFENENMWESIDKETLTPQELNIRRALIGVRCPSVKPSDNSQFKDSCPLLESGEYNMARKFVFQKDDASAITTGFATNPFTGRESSSLAGILNLEEMTDQLQALSPDKNVIKLIRLRQILEQLQVCDGCANEATQISPTPIRKVGKTGLGSLIYPNPLRGVDTIQIFLPGYEEIMNYLNSTTTIEGAPARNINIKSLMKAYGYTTAKEAYPRISQELDDILDDATGQVIDQLRDVFLKRIEQRLEVAKNEAKHRLVRFVEYVRDVNSIVKMELENPDASILFDFKKQIGPSTYVVGADAKKAFPIQSGDIPINSTLLRRNALSDPESNALNTQQRKDLIAAAVYKMKIASTFIGIGDENEKLANNMDQYLTPDFSAIGKAAIAADLDERVRMALRDAYMLYTGIFNKTAINVLDEERDIAPQCTYNIDFGGNFCDLGINVKIYKDARTKMENLVNNFQLMLEEVSDISNEFSDLMSATQTRQQELSELFELLNDIVESYDTANTCVGMPVNDKSLWKLPVHLGFASSAVETSETFYAYGTSGGQKIVETCRNGIIDFNKNMKKLANLFVCGGSENNDEL